MTKDQIQTTRVDKTLKKGRRSRRGMQMSEALLILGGIAIVLAIIIGLYSMVMTGWRNMQTTQLVMRTASVVETSYRSFATYDNGSLLPVIKNRGEFTDKEIYVSGSNTLMRSPFNTNMTVVGDGARNFTITVTDLQPGPCEKLLEAMVDPGRRVFGASVNGTAMTVPFNNTAIASACSGASDDFYDVAITF